MSNHWVVRSSNRKHQQCEKMLIIGERSKSFLLLWQRSSYENETIEFLPHLCFDWCLINLLWMTDLEWILGLSEFFKRKFKNSHSASPINWRKKSATEGRTVFSRRWTANQCSILEDNGRFLGTEERRSRFCVDISSGSGSISYYYLEEISTGHDSVEGIVSTRHSRGWHHSSLYSF